MAMPKNAPINKDVIFNKGGINGPPVKKSSDLKRLESKAPTFTKPEPVKAVPKTSVVQTEQQKDDDKIVVGLSSNETMTAILSYLSILVLIPLLAIEKKDRNDFIKYHLEQGLNIFILEIIIWLACIVLSIITFGIFAIIASVIWVVILILMIIAIIKAVQGEKWEVPVLGAVKFVKL